MQGKPFLEFSCRPEVWASGTGIHSDCRLPSSYNSGGTREQTLLHLHSRDVLLSLGDYSSPPPGAGNQTVTTQSWATKTAAFKGREANHTKNAL